MKCDVHGVENCKSHGCAIWKEDFLSQSIVKCESGYHGSLSESLSRPGGVCKICGRNYESENFQEACSYFGLNPKSITNNINSQIFNILEGEKDENRS